MPILDVVRRARSHRRERLVAASAPTGPHRFASVLTHGRIAARFEPTVCVKRELKQAVHVTTIGSSVDYTEGAATDLLDDGMDSAGRRRLTAPHTIVQWFIADTRVPIACGVSIEPILEVGRA